MATRHHKKVGTVEQTDDSIVGNRTKKMDMGGHAALASQPLKFSCFERTPHNEVVRVRYFFKNVGQSADDNILTLALCDASHGDKQARSVQSKRIEVHLLLLFGQHFE